jgi:choline kinase
MLHTLTFQMADSINEQNCYEKFGSQHHETNILSTSKVKTNVKVEELYIFLNIKNIKR